MNWKNLWFGARNSWHKFRKRRIFVGAMLILHHHEVQKFYSPPPLSSLHIYHHHFSKSQTPPMEFVPQMKNILPAAHFIMHLVSVMPQLFFVATCNLTCYVINLLNLRLPLSTNIFRRVIPWMSVDRKA